MQASANERKKNFDELKRFFFLFSLFFIVIQKQNKNGKI